MLRLIALPGPRGARGQSQQEVAGEIQGLSQYLLGHVVWALPQRLLGHAAGRIREQSGTPSRRLLVQESLPTCWRQKDLPLPDSEEHFLPSPVSLQGHWFALGPKRCPQTYFRSGPGWCGGTGSASERGSAPWPWEPTKRHSEKPRSLPAARGGRQKPCLPPLSSLSPTLFSAGSTWSPSP